MDEIPERVLKRIDFGLCWLWTGSTSGGYGQFTIDGVHHSAHQFVYELLVGPIPDGLELDHLCMVKRCCNPDHLEPVTGTENRRRRATTGRRYIFVEGVNLRVCKLEHTGEYSRGRCLGCAREYKDRCRRVA